MTIIETGIRAFLATVFAWAALSKLRSRAGRRQFREYLVYLLRVTGPQAARLAAPLVSVELCIPLLLALDATATAGLVVACALNVALLGAVLFAVRTSRTKPCRCFGDTSASMGMWQVLRNSALLLLSLLGLTLSLGSAPPSADISSWPAAAGFGIMAALLLMAGEKVRDLFHDADPA
ncbi:MauE/DoxX family redox-associated membrane protein [Nonomuraea wenchangensis]